MKPHELLQRQRRNRGKAAVPPQMRARNSAPAPAAAAGAKYPARRPSFPGETREQELARLKAAAVVQRPGPPGGGTVSPAAAAPPPEPAEDAITMCACPAHDDGNCGHVATLGAVWPMAAGVQAIDLCERCARAIKADPVGQLVTGLQFVALLPPMHDALPEGDDDDGDPQGKWGPHASPEEAAEKQAPPPGVVTP
jgi:hypothetical protein